MVQPFRQFLKVTTTRVPLVRQEFKTTSIFFQNKKTKTPANQWPYATNHVMPSTSDYLKIREIIEYFKNSSEENSNCIPKDELNEVKMGYKLAAIHYYYLMPKGNMSLLAKDEEDADYKVRRYHYISKADAKKKLSVTFVQTENPDLHQETFDTHVIIHHYEVEPEGCNDIPDVEKGCIRTVEVYEKLKSRLDDFTRTSNYGRYVTKSDETGNYIETKEKVRMAMINFYEYTHLDDNNTKAMVCTVKIQLDSEELERLKDLAFMQVYSAKKQLIININAIVTKMKTGDAADEDFSVRGFSEIESDMDLTIKRKEQQQKFHKTAEGMFKNINNQKDKSLPVDLVCQKFQFKSKEEPDVIHYACKVVETTDKDLRKFVGKALVQKVDAKHQTFTKPHEVITFMLDNHVPVDNK